MILPSDLRDLVLAHIYKRISASGRSAALRFSEVEEDFDPHIGVMLVRSALERLNGVHSFLETDLYRGKDGYLHWKITSLSQYGERYIEEKLREDGSIISRLLKQNEALGEFF